MYNDPMPAADWLGALRPRFDLGLRALLPEWRALASTEGLGGDLQLGLLLAARTLPFSLFLAVLSGVPASSGIVSAAVGSAVCVFFGGTRVALSGPGLATALVVSAIVARHGLGELGAVMLLAGALQVAAGVLGIARFVRLVPRSVIHGLVIGVGATLLAAHLPYAVGVTVAADASPLARLDRIGAHLPSVDPIVLAITGGSALLGLLSLLSPRIPGGIIAMAIATGVVAALGLDVPTLTETETFPLPRLPAAPSSHYAQLVGSALDLWLTCTVCTTLSAIALEKKGGGRIDADQELIGNGLATTLLAFLGGLPATQMIARSLIAVRSGVTSRRPALVQALAVLVVGLALWPIMELVPIAALTGTVLAIAVPLLDPRPVRDLARVSRFALGISTATAVVILFSGLVAGVQLGLAIALVGATVRLARTRALLHRSKDPDAPHQVSFSGPITFLASLELEALRLQLAELDATQGVVFDLRSVVTLDGAGAHALIEVIDEVRARDGKVALIAPSMIVRERLQIADAQPRLAGSTIEPGALGAAIAPTDRDVDAILGKQRSFLARPHLLAGITRFREETRDHYDSLFAHLADGQHPHTMFITCADSRVSPGLLMGAHPGDLFIVRCIGALVPPADSGSMPQEGAAVEYGVGVLGVRHVIVCGHSKCGAVGALKKGKVPAELVTLEIWSKLATAVAGDIAVFTDVDDAARAVTVRQVENLMTYPLVRDRVAKGELQLHAWFYDLGAVELYEWDEKKKAFAILGADPRATSIPPPPPHGIATSVPASAPLPDDAE